MIKNETCDGSRGPIGGNVNIYVLHAEDHVGSQYYSIFSR